MAPRKDAIRLKSESETIPVNPLDRKLQTALRASVDGKVKPPGSLGRIEDLAVRLGLIQGRLDPRLERVALFVFAGDHGLTELRRFEVAFGDFRVS
jgi:NaMN:DMB phosphoribosyltransferase